MSHTLWNKNMKNEERAKGHNPIWRYWTCPLWRMSRIRSHVRCQLQNWVIAMGSFAQSFSPLRSWCRMRPCLSLMHCAVHETWRNHIRPPIENLQDHAVCDRAGTEDTTQAWFVITISWTAWSNEWTVSLPGVNRFIVIHCVLITKSRVEEKDHTNRWALSDQLLSFDTDIYWLYLNILCSSNLPGWTAHCSFLLALVAAKLTSLLRPKLPQHLTPTFTEFTCVTCLRWVASAWRCLKQCQWRHRDFEISTHFYPFHSFRSILSSWNCLKMALIVKLMNITWRTYGHLGWASQQNGEIQGLNAEAMCSDAVLSRVLPRSLTRESLRWHTLAKLPPNSCIESSSPPARRRL